jgi:mRNA interferase RelE/StbE
VQQRIRRVTLQLETLDDPRSRLVPYSTNLKGLWKLRVGDFRLVCQLLQGNGYTVLVLMAAHRSEVYDKRHVRSLLRRGGS